MRAQNGMSYSWDGVVTRVGAEKPNKLRRVRHGPLTASIAPFQLKHR